MSRLDDLLNIGAAFDWITPSVAFINDVLNGPTSDFGIPISAGISPGDIKRLFDQRGIKVWGLMLNPKGNTLMLTVNRSQATAAYDLLKQNGVPLEYSPVAAEPPANTGSIFDILDRLF